MLQLVPMWAASLTPLPPPASHLCSKAGVGRVGSLIACWRIANGVSVESALATEAFNAEFGSLEQAAFVKRFASLPTNRVRFRRKGNFDGLPSGNFYPPQPPSSASTSGNGPSNASTAPVGTVSFVREAHTQYPEGEEKVAVSIVRSDGWKCEREVVRKGEFRHVHPATEQMVIVWDQPPHTVFIIKKLGPALLPHLLAAAKYLASEKKIRVLVEPNVLAAIHALPAHVREAEGITGLTLEAWKPSRAVDLVICMGGDGVMLAASKLFQGPMPPVMGFNLGSMGFLTPHSFIDARNELDALLDPAKRARGVPVTLRMRLHAEINRAHDGSIFSYEVFNEMVLDRGPSPFLCMIACYEIKNGGERRLMTKVQADGIIVSTATGSTAYSVSAGGSMVHPSVPAILMTPVRGRGAPGFCPHPLDSSLDVASLGA